MTTRWVPAVRAWTNPVIEMYRVPMDQLAREDIAAAAAAHRELGGDYDGAVAEGLIERIGAEIDKRVDARLGQRDGPAQRRDDGPAQRGGGGQLNPGGRLSWEVTVLALGSMTIGGITSGALLQGRGPPAYSFIVLLIWIIIGVVNVAYARRR